MWDENSSTDRASASRGYVLPRMRGLAMAVCFIGLLVICGVLLFRQTVHEQIRTAVLAHLNQRLEGVGCVAQLRSARWFEGQGVQLEGFSIWERGASGPSLVLAVDRAFVRTDFKIVDCLTCVPTIDQVTIEKTTLRLAKNQAGSWNLETILAALMNDEQRIRLDFPVRCRGAAIAFEGRALGLPEDLVIRDLDLDAFPEHGELIDTIHGHCSGPMVRNLGFQFAINRKRGTWKGEVGVDDVALSGELNGLIPSPWRDMTAILETVRGRINLHCSAAGQLDFSDAPRFDVTAQVSDVQWLDPEAPYRVQDGRLRLHADNEGLEITSASASVGFGQVTVDTLQRRGWGDSNNWKIKGQATGIRLTERLLPWLPQELRRLWRNYSPTGLLNMDFFIENRLGKIERDIQTTIIDGSFSHHTFPYRLEHCSGSVAWVNDHIEVNATAYEGQQPIKIEAQIDNPGPNWVGSIRGSCDSKLPIDDKLHKAIQVMPNLADVVRQYQVTGRFGIDGAIYRLDPNRPEPNIEYEITLENATVRYDHFSYPFYNVSGRIIVKNETTTFESIEGFNNNGIVKCNGSWHPAGGLNLLFTAETVLLDEELRMALPDYARTVWNQLRPSGTVDYVSLHLGFSPTRPGLDINLEAQIYDNSPTHLSTVTLRPVWFPYEFRRLTGKFKMGEGKITLEELTAQHGPTQIDARGIGVFDDQRWRIDIQDILATNIHLDEELLTAMPPSLSSSLRQLDFEGQLMLQGRVGLAGTSLAYSLDPPAAQADGTYVNLLNGFAVSDPHDDLELDWDVNVTMARGRLEAGLPFTNVNGGVDLRGSYRREQVQCTGQLAIDSMMYRDVQITSLRGPLSIDNQRVGLGAAADSFGQDVTPASLTGRVFGGTLRCDCEVQNDAGQIYNLRAGLTQASLSEFGLETALQHLQLSGQAHGEVRLTGSMNDYHSARGAGTVQIRNARIYELPIILALLKVIRVNKPDRSAFDSGDLMFTVQGENIDFSKIEMNGDAISLIGKGHLNTSGEIDLDFYTVMGRNKIVIPVITQLYRAGSQQILWVQVGGSVNHPTTKTKTFPGLDTLRGLFPDFNLDL